MALKSTICGIVHQARQIRSRCPTMISSFKLHDGQSAYFDFFAELVIQGEKNLRNILQ